MDGGQLRRIQMIAELARRSASALRENSEVGNGVAVSLLHDAVEHSLYLALLIGHQSPGKREEFKELIARVNVIYKTQTRLDMPFQRQLENLNRVRVDFKHHGHVPPRSVTLEVCENAREFVITLIRNLLKIEIEDFHPVMFLRTVVIREHLETTQVLATSENFREAMNAAARALWYLDSGLAAIFRQPRPPGLSYDFRGVPGLNQLYRQLIDFITNGDRSILISSIMMASGLDVREFSQMRAKLPHVSRTYGGTFHFSYTNSYICTVSDLNDAVSQITRVALWLEERFPTLRYEGEAWKI